MVLAAFVLTVVAELVAFVLIAGQVGVLATLLLLVLVSLVGFALLKRQGLRVLRAARAELARDQLPTHQVLDGLVLLLAGALLAFPGFVTGALGFVLLAPPARVGVRRLATALGLRRLQRSVGWVANRGPVVDARGWSTGGHGGQRGNGDAGGASERRALPGPRPGGQRGSA